MGTFDRIDLICGISGCDERLESNPEKPETIGTVRGIRYVFELK